MPYSEAGKIMIVDDQPIVLESLLDYFKRYGIGSDQLATFENAATARLALRDPLQKFRFVLVDGLDGRFVEVAQAAKDSEIPSTAIVLYTNSMRDYINEAEGLGILVYSKNIMPRDIPGLIKATS